MESLSCYTYKKIWRAENIFMDRLTTYLISSPSSVTITSSNACDILYYARFVRWIYSHNTQFPLQFFGFLILSKFPGCSFFFRYGTNFFFKFIQSKKEKKEEGKISNPSNFTVDDGFLFFVGKNRFHNILRNTHSLLLISNDKMQFNTFYLSPIFI